MEDNDAQNKKVQQQNDQACFMHSHCSVIIEDKFSPPTGIERKTRFISFVFIQGLILQIKI